VILLGINDPLSYDSKMINELAMRLFSRRSLTKLQAKDQITGLSEFGGGLMRPDKCGEFEPIRTPFDSTDISEPIRWLAQPHGEFFYRKGRPLHASGEMWNLTHSPSARFPSPLFTIIGAVPPVYQFPTESFMQIDCNECLVLF
jgi:hypothetical protein